MEAGIITETVNAALALERIGIIGLLTAIAVAQFILRFRDKKNQEIMERQIVPIEQMTAVQKEYNGHYAIYIFIYLTCLSTNTYRTFRYFIKHAMK